MCGAFYHSVPEVFRPSFSFDSSYGDFTNIDSFVLLQRRCNLRSLLVVIRTVKGLDRFQNLLTSGVTGEEKKKEKKERMGSKKEKASLACHMAHRMEMKDIVANCK